MLTIGSISDGKRVFFTRFVWATIDPAVVGTIWAKKYHGASPAVSQTTKGTSLFGVTRKPKLKTNQKTVISTSG